MQFDERIVGDYRIFAGALEAPKGDGYIATTIVHRVQGVANAPREANRRFVARGARGARGRSAIIRAFHEGSGR